MRGLPSFQDIIAKRKHRESAERQAKRDIEKEKRDIAFKESVKRLARQKSKKEK